ncbi:GroES-like protein [Xylariaceae sp. FL0804]|nr:GroES-like protein [Xylariaceae sp. FL0804]
MLGTSRSTNSSTPELRQGLVAHVEDIDDEAGAHDDVVPETAPAKIKKTVPAAEEEEGERQQQQQQHPPLRLRDMETEALVVHRAGGDFEMTPIILDEVRPDEVLVEMKYSGICHSDFVMQQGLLPGAVSFPAIFGHEGAGIVRAVGSAVSASRERRFGTFGSGSGGSGGGGGGGGGGGKSKSESQAQLAVGDAVLLSFNTCGSCGACARAPLPRPARCHRHDAVNLGAVRVSDGSTPARLRDRDGGGGAVPVRSQFFGQSSFSRLSVVHERSVVRCAHPDLLHLYAPLGCGFQTGAGTVLNVLRPTARASVAVFGLGSVGLAALMAARHLGARRIVAVDVLDERLALAAELGATHLVNAAAKRRVDGVDVEVDVDVVDAVRRAGATDDDDDDDKDDGGDDDGDGGVDFAIECTGVPAVVEDVVRSVGAEGTAALVGIYAAGSRVTLDPLSFILGNKKLVGVIMFHNNKCGDANPPEFIPELIELHQNGRFPIEKLCKTYPVSQMSEAVRDMHAGKASIPEQTAAG